MPPQQQKRVEVNMRVEESEPKSRENGCSEVGACLVVENHGRGVASRGETKHAVTGDKRRRTQGHGAFDPCRLLKGSTHAGYACKDNRPSQMEQVRDTAKTWDFCNPCRRTKTF